MEAVIKVPLTSDPLLVPVRIRDRYQEHQELCKCKYTSQGYDHFGTHNALPPVYRP